MKNEIDFQIVESRAELSSFAKFSSPYVVELTIRQFFSKQAFERVKRVMSLSNLTVNVVFTQKMDELDKYTDEEILEYLRTRNDNR